MFWLHGARSQAGCGGRVRLMVAVCAVAPARCILPLLLLSLLLLLVFLHVKQQHALHSRDRNVGPRLRW